VDICFRIRNVLKALLKRSEHIRRGVTQRLSDGHQRLALRALTVWESVSGFNPLEDLDTNRVKFTGVA
jgi:hypothetical protein